MQSKAVKHKKHAIKVAKRTVRGGTSLSAVYKPHFDSYRRLFWLKNVTVIALICGLGLSWRLWISSRLFPLSPVSRSLPALAFPFDYFLFFLLLGLLAVAVMVAQPRRLMFAVLALAGILSLWDQTRWQPWFYQYYFILAAMAFCGWKKSGEKNPQVALNGCRLIVIFTYLWGGLQKLNANFIKETWPDMAGPVLHFLPKAIEKIPSFAILTIPFMEVAIALGLATRKYRNQAAVLAIATHIVILVLLIGSGENSVVWPWNIAMSIFVVILFWNNREIGVRYLISGDRFLVLAVLLFGVLPAFSFVDLWDSYLSASLYSGNTDQAVIYVSPAVIERLPKAIHEHIWQNTQPYFLDINRWSYGELNAPIYPEPRVYKSVTEYICKLAGDSADDVRLRIKDKPNPFTGVRKSEYYDCKHLDSEP